MPRKTGFDLGALWTAIDEATEGALYNLRRRCKERGWTPRMWAQTQAEGALAGFARFLFIGTDDKGIVRYFDYTTAPDPNGLAHQLKLTEIVKEASSANKNIKVGLARLDRGLDPIPEEDAKEVLALN
jgi:hypothetical protein